MNPKPRKMDVQYFTLPELKACCVQNDPLPPIRNGENRNGRGCRATISRMSGRREKKPVRQLSLDCNIKSQFRRQISEDIVSKTAIQAGRQLKIAWTLEKSEPESDQVEIVAKKCGQPKPKPAVRPPRSPFAPDENTVLFSRQQLTERLRSSWQKNSGSRHNLDIFLNRSVDSECSDTGGSLPKTPDDTESSDNETEEVLHCLHATRNNETPTMITSSQSESSANNASNKLCASARRMNFRNMGRQRSILESPCPTPEPTKAALPPTFRNISRHRVGDSSSSCASTPEPRKQLPRMMSAPPRSVPPSSANRKLAKAPSMETRCPTPISLTQRIKSAPPKRKLKSSKRRGGKTGGGGGDSSDDGEESTKGQGGKRGIRRGVDRGEVVTMVSLVSPAGTDSDEPTCVPIPPPTPKPTVTVEHGESKEEPKPTPPPPPIICLRKPPKSVTFRPSVVVPSSGSQYQTNFALRRPAVLTHQSSLPAQSSLPSAGQHNKLMNNNRVHGGGTQRTGGQQRTGGGNTAQPSPSVQPVQQQPGVVLSRAPPPVVRKRVVQDNGKLQQPIKEGTDKDVIPIINNTNTLETSTRKTTISAASNSNLQQTANSSTTTATSTIVLSATPATTMTTTTTATTATTTNEAIDPAKPDFKSAKEKECWDLFKKMSDRGLSVSFETVLRGLLTPTEYRMRKTALLSVC